MSDAFRPCPGGKSILKRGRGNLYSLGELLCHGAPNQLADNVSYHDAADTPIRLAKRCQPAQLDGVHDLIWHVSSGQRCCNFDERHGGHGAMQQDSKMFRRHSRRSCRGTSPGSPQVLAQSLRRSNKLHLRSMINQLRRQRLSGFCWPSVSVGQRSQCRQCARCQFHTSRAWRPELNSPI